MLCPAELRALIPRRCQSMTALALLKEVCITTKTPGGCRAYALFSVHKAESVVEAQGHPQSVEVLLLGELGRFSGLQLALGVLEGLGLDT